MQKPFDCHCHLDEIENREAIIKEAKQKLSGIINCGTNRESNMASLRLAKQHKSFIWPALAIHPIYFHEFSKEKIEKETKFIEENINDIVAIGETGLDFAVIKKKENFDTLKKKQEEFFVEFIELAKQYDLPLIVHSRWAATKALELLIKQKAEKVVLHCFNAPLKDVKRAIDNGYLLSIATNILYNQHIKQYIENFELNNFVLETDTPYLFKPINKPSNVWLVAKEIAKIKEIKEEKVIEITNKNIKNLFGIKIC